MSLKETESCVWAERLGYWRHPATAPPSASPPATTPPPAIALPFWPDLPSCHHPDAWRSCALRTCVNVPEPSVHTVTGSCPPHLRPCSSARCLHPRHTVTGSALRSRVQVPGAHVLATAPL
jgi:hypothetical protein